MWCETHNEKAIGEPACCWKGHTNKVASFPNGISGCSTVLILLVPKDAASIVVRAGEFVDIDPADRQPPGVYRLTGEVVRDV